MSSFEGQTFYQKMHHAYSADVTDISKVVQAVEKMLASDDPVQLFYEWSTAKRFGLRDFRFLLSAIGNLEHFRAMKAQSRNPE